MYNECLKDGLNIVAFENVKNALILKEIWQEDSGFILIDLSMVYSKFHIDLSFNKANFNHVTHKMKTKFLGLEVLYQLSPTTNINEALKIYGIKESTDTIAIVDLKIDDNEVFESIINRVEGKRISIEEILNQQCSNNEKKCSIIKLFKISSQELEIANLEDAIVTRIATKDFI